MESEGREILPERCRAEIATERIATTTCSVGVHGLVRSAVVAQVGLLVALEVRRTDGDWSLHGLLADAGSQPATEPDVVAGVPTETQRTRGVLANVCLLSS